MIITDPALARRLLERAIATTTKPTLSIVEVDDLMALASSQDANGATVYTSADLNRSASIGWQTKAGMTSDQYDLGGGTGKTLDRSQWFDHCMRLSASYASGAMGVVGVSASSSYRSIPAVSSTMASTEAAT